MLFADLDLPTELLRARDEDRLVIFAGAGVSKGPPALQEPEWALIHEWALYLEGDFPEFVKRLQRREVHPPNLDFLADLCGRIDGRGSFDRDALFEYPDELARYLIHLLENPPQNPWFLRDLEACLARLGESGVEPRLFRKLTNRFRRLGGQVSEELRACLEDDEEEEQADGVARRRRGDPSRSG